MRDRFFMMAALIVTCSGCQQEMANQRRIDSLEQPIRERPQHVVPLRSVSDSTERLTEDRLLRWQTVDLRKLLLRGRERFLIHCSPCHDATGSGNGMVARRGFAYPPSYHSDRLRSKPLRYFYDVATEGIGKMPSYQTYLSERDRWAVAAYIRTLQFSQYAPVATLPAEDREAL